MGKLAILAAATISLIAFLFQRTSQTVSIETTTRSATSQYDTQSRALAEKGRKLVIAHWAAMAGTATTRPFNARTIDGGNLSIVDFTRNGNLLDFTVRGEYERHVHEIRTSLRWQNFNIFGIQFKAADLFANISPNATLNISDIAMDDQSLVDLESFLVTELGLISDLSDLGLGSADLVADMESALLAGGHTVSVDLIDDADRTTYSQQDGLFFPDQVTQVIASFQQQHPGLTQTANSAADLSSSFGVSDSYELLRVTNDLHITSDFTGNGILVVEGNLTVDPDVNFDWTGLIVISPPPTNLNPSVDLNGNVDITGSLIALQEGVPNVGHMDVSIHRDLTGAWPVANGQDFFFYKHTHNYSGYYGWNVVFSSIDPLVTVNSAQTRFDEFLLSFDPNTDIYLSLANTGNHGRANINVDLGAQGQSVSSVAAGFNSDMAFSIATPHRTKLFKINELEHLEIQVTRLSALKKLWDTGDPHAGCVFNGRGIGPEWGTVCVWGNHDRMEALALRIHAADGTMIYEAPIYWHRQLAEEEEFEEEMNDLINQITSNNYGLNLNVGDNVTITQDNSFVNSMTAFQNVPQLGYDHLGTWHQHWQPDDPGNPVYSTP